MITFNEWGMLSPATLISCTVEEFEFEFSVKLASERRVQLINQYRLFCRDLKQLLGLENIVQWIDGSFVTKSNKPRDIDLVFFVDCETAGKNEKELKQFIYPASLHDYGIDSYFVIEYPPDSVDKYKTESDRAYWTDHFGKSKHNRQNKRVPKGFLEIIV